MKKKLGIIVAGILLLNTLFIAPKESKAATINKGFPQGEVYENGGYDPSAAAPVYGNWSSNSPFSGTETNALKWEKEITDITSNFSPTVMDKEGNIYYTTYLKEVVSIDKHGELRWKVGISSNANVAPAIGHDGTIYVSAGSSLYAFNPDGTVKWNVGWSSKINDKPIPDPTFLNSPAIGSDGTIYMPDSKDNRLYALNGDDGSVKWISDRAPSAWDRKATPVIDSDGTIYLINVYDNYIYAYNKNGTLKWSLGNLATIKNIILLKDGKIATSSSGTSNGTINIIDRSGKIVNSFRTGSNGGDFIVQNLFNDQLIVDDGYNITSFNEDGTKNWSYNTSDSTQNLPVIDKNGVIYFGSNDGRMYALKPNGTVKWQLDLLQHYGGGSAYYHFYNGGISMDKNGTLITAGEFYKNGVSTRKIIAIGDDSVPPSDGTCSGYLEIIEAKTSNGTITQEEIKEAQLRLSKNLYNLSLIKNGAKVIAIEDDSIPPSDGTCSGYLEIIGAKISNGTITQEEIKEAQLRLSKDLNNLKAYIIYKGYPQGEMYDNGGYDPSAVAPVYGNWSYNSPFSGTETNALKWEKDITNVYPYISPTVIDKEGNTYYTTYYNEVVSIDKHGEQRWKVTLDTNPKYIAPAIGHDGTIYVTAGPSIYAFNPDGTVKWKSTPGLTGFDMSPAIGSDGTLYIPSTSNGYKLYAFNGNDGSVKWISDPVPSTWDRKTTPVIDSDGTIYLINVNNNYIYAYNKNGTLKWSLSNPTEKIILLKDGKIATSSSGTSSGTINIIDRSGKLVNSFRTASNGGDFIVQNLFNDQLIVDDGYNITSYNEDGTKNWSYKTSASTQHQPVIDKNGVIYFGSDDGRMYALKPDGTVKWQLDLLQHYGGGSAYYHFYYGGISMDKNGTLITAGEFYKNGVSTRKIIAIGDDSVPPNDGTCSGYLEIIEAKTSNGTIIQEEIKEAQLRLSKNLYNLSLIKNGAKVIDIEDDSVSPSDGTCSGYLEQIEAKIVNGTITEEEIKEAELRLSKDLYNLSLKEK